MTKVLVLGAGGMLGSMVAGVLSGHGGTEVHATVRGAARPALPGVTFDRFDARRDGLARLLDAERYEWVVNAIGMLSSRIEPRSVASVRQAIEINALFPARLAQAAARRGQRVIEIATDGVFSGLSGPYDEQAPHDAWDVYGQTKSLGEVGSPNVVRLRCSIVGRERSAAPCSLLERALAAPAGATLRGFTAQRWNGVTTLQFARLCAAIVGGAPIEGLHHVVPGDDVTKARLLRLAVAAFGRDDLTVVDEPGPVQADRRLATVFPEANHRLWAAAGYAQPPTVGAMLDELAATSHAS